MRSLFFLDVEASSLSHDSFPIEVAWVNGTGEGETHLIRPADEWLHPSTGWPDWSGESERVHGLSLQQVRDEGESHDEVARRAAQLLASRRVMVASDAPQFDEQWLAKLLAAAGLRHRVRVVDVTSVYILACRPLLSVLPPWDGAERDRAEARVREAARQIIARAEEAEAVRPRVRHRALPDAEGMWRTWRAVGDGVAEWLAREQAK